jgi:5-methyltetrahydropteroyltriglutamate--homocysteine methyltransferase
VTADRILTTHAGSLPRPPRLVELYAARVAGEPVDEAELVREGKAATRWVVERQREAGIDIPSDGEQLREAFFLYVQRRMTGFSGVWKRPARTELDDYPEFAARMRKGLEGQVAVSNFEPPKATGPVAYADPDANKAELDTFAAALKNAGGDFEDAFMTAPSPGIVATAMKNEHYDSEDAYLDALAEALRIEYEAAHQHGYLLQIDAPDLAMERHFSYASHSLDTFVDFVERVIARINAALRNVPRERVRLHVCWGNYESPHDKDVALEAVLPAILQANVGAFLLPFANPRHQHEIKLFRDAPLGADQSLIVGVIDTQTAFVEHPETIADRLERAAEMVGDPARIQAGTDCGFDTSAGMGRLTPDVVWAKLKAMQDGARLASERLF